MGPIQSLFEAHLNVSDLRRSMAFYGDTLGLQMAHYFAERQVAFYWMGERGNSMLGLWETGSTPLKMSLHIAFRMNLPDLLETPARLSAAGIAPRDITGAAVSEAVVLAWMPAASVYFEDPDRNSLEFICMLPEDPEPELGVVKWSRWTQLRKSPDSVTR